MGAFSDFLSSISRFIEYQGMQSGLETCELSDFSAFENRINQLIDSDPITRQIVDNSQYTGFQHRNLSKLSDMMSMFATLDDTMYKSKMAICLLYADLLSCKKLGTSISGWSYQQSRYDEIEPIFFNNLLDAPTIRYTRKVLKNGHDMICIIPVAKIDSSLFSQNELSIIKRISMEFKGQNSLQIKERSQHLIAGCRFGPQQVLLF